MNAAALATAAVLVAIGAPLLALTVVLVRRRRRWSVDVQVHGDDGRDDQTP